MDRVTALRPRTLRTRSPQANLAGAAWTDDEAFAAYALDATRRRAGFFHAGRDPQAVDDQLLYDRLLNEFPTWLTDARAAGVIP
ncbi:VWA domain-containing protein [Streptomyces sp. NPDC054837]